MSPLEIKRVVEEFYEEWNSGSIDFERLIHEEIANHQPGREAELGRDAFGDAINGVMGAVPDSEWTILKLVVDGDLVVCHNGWSGTWSGSVLRGVATPPGIASPSSTSIPIA